MHTFFLFPPVRLVKEEKISPLFPKAHGGCAPMPPLPPRHPKAANGNQQRHLNSLRHTAGSALSDTYTRVQLHTQAHSTLRTTRWEKYSTVPISQTRTVKCRGHGACPRSLLISGRAGCEPRQTGCRVSAQSHRTMLQNTVNSSKESLMLCSAGKLAENNFRNYGFHSFLE